MSEKFTSDYKKISENGLTLFYPITGCALIE